MFIIRDVMQYGLGQFWMMVGLVMAYTYLALPLFVEFIKILRPRRAGEPQPPEVRGAKAPLLPEVRGAIATSHEGPRKSTPDPHEDRSHVATKRPTTTNWNRISAWEAVGYTCVILFIAALALGWFDVMLPWDTQ